MLGRFDEARAILAESRAELAERGGELLLANITAFESVWVELWAGDPAAAAAFAAEGFRLHEELGEQIFLSGAAGNLAQALYALDRLDEADAWAGRAADLGATDDVSNGDALAADQGQGARAPWRARRGGAARARGGRDRRRHRHRSTGRETRTPTSRRCSCSPARPTKRSPRSSTALERYERKRNVVSAQRARARLAEPIQGSEDAA